MPPDRRVSTDHVSLYRRYFWVVALSLIPAIPAGLWLVNSGPWATLFGFSRSAVSTWFWVFALVHAAIHVTLLILDSRNSKRLRLAIQSGQICRYCYYDLSGVDVPACPECGKPITRPASTLAQTTESKPSPPPTDAPH